MVVGSTIDRYYYFLNILVYVWYYTTLIINGKLTRIHIPFHVHVLWWTHVDFGIKVVIIVVSCLFQPHSIIHFGTYLTTLHCVHTQSVMLIIDPFSVLNNQNLYVYAIPRFLKDCSYSLYNNKVVRLLYCCTTVSRTLQDIKAFGYHVNYYTLLLPSATMYTKSAANLDTIIDCNLYYSNTNRSHFCNVIKHVYLGLGVSGKLCTFTLVFNVPNILIYILGICSLLLVYGPLYLLMKTKRLYMYWLINRFMLNYKTF